MSKTKNTQNAQYSGSVQMDSASTNQSPRVPTLTQHLWPETSPTPFLVQPGHLELNLPSKPAYKRLWAAMETAGSLIWVFACAVVSIIWVAAYRFRQKITGAK
jgi:hypothetical protein